MSKPTYPSSGFGYIKIKKNVTLENVFEVENSLKNQAKVLLKNLLKIQAIFGIVVYLWLTLTLLKSIFIHAEEIYNKSEYVFTKAFKNSKEFVTFPLKYFEKYQTHQLTILSWKKEKSNVIQ